MSQSIIRQDEHGLRCQADGSTVRPTCTYPPERMAWPAGVRELFASDLAKRWHHPVYMNIDGQTQFSVGQRVTARHIVGTMRARIYTPDHSEIWWIDYTTE